MEEEEFPFPLCGVLESNVGGVHSCPSDWATAMLAERVTTFEKYFLCYSFTGRTKEYYYFTEIKPYAAENCKGTLKIAR